ncbi:MAG: amidohydrolase family protein [Bacteroidia bacterium]|nr:amidohydrolase family protein [Bacteroidia bacterium]
MYDTIIRNGKVVTHNDIFDADVAIEGGKIAAIGNGLGSAKEEFDAGGLYVMPGCIDPHTHIGLFVDKEKDLKSETGAAVYSGTTTVMHCLIGGGPLIDQFNEYKGLIETVGHTDMTFYGALLTNDQLHEIEKLAEMGVTSWKFLMGYKGKAGESIGLKGVNLDDGYLYDGFEIIRKIGGLPMIHAEHIEMIYSIEKKYQNENTLKAWADARPNVAEEIDLRIGCSIAEEVGVPLYQVHSSVGTCPAIAEEFRNRGNKVFLETCPHYFVTDYNGENLNVSPLIGKISPPIRSPQDREMIEQNLLKGGAYDCIGTDSANSMYKDKWADGSIWNIMLDFSSIGYMLPLVLSELVNKKGMDLTEAVRLTSYNSSKIHGLYPKKGVMGIGSDADILIVDLNKTRKVNVEEMPSMSDYSLYDGWEITGWPVQTIVRGTTVFKENQIVGEPGFGEYVPCKPEYLDYRR